MGQSSAHPPRRNRNIVHAVVQYNARLARIGMGYEATTTTAHVPSCRNIYTLLHCIRKQRVSLGVGGSICRRSRGVDLMHMRAVGPAPAGRGGETIIVRPTYGYPSVSCHVQCSAGAGIDLRPSPSRQQRTHAWSTVT